VKIIRKHGGQIVHHKAYHLPGIYCILFLAVVVPGLFLGACYQKKYTKEFFKNLVRPEFPYDLGKPVEKFKMPKSLEEVSGIAYYKNGVLECVQDEKGSLFMYDIQSRQIIRKIKFEKKGDFEDNALSGDTAWVIKSNGQLYRFTVNAGNEAHPILFNTPLKRKNNVEGLCYKPDDHSLLLACKDEAGIDTKRQGRSVFQFNLSTGELDKNPFLLITNDDFIRELKSFGLDPLDHTPFKPSGVAIHPQSGNIYLISSIGKLLVVFNPRKEIIAMAPLKRSMFQQPEGICFSPEGDLFIASEGDNKDGEIVQFKPVY